VILDIDEDEIHNNHITGKKNEHNIQGILRKCTGVNKRKDKCLMCVLFGIMVDLS
jgi:hypothetical protein